MLVPFQPALVLAPMEGVTDAPMRALQGECGAFSYAVAEFLRVTQIIPPTAVIRKHVPELLTGGRTPTGLPVQVQLLGGDPERMAETAARVHALGAAAIDLNFGCPAKTVNRHDGGAALLKHPQRIRAIVAAVRAAVPPEVPVSAKLRLGWDCTGAIFENVAMAAEGGASWLTIHARTRVQGYAPPVNWALVGQVRARLGIPVIANGDIWTVADFRRCREETGCRHFMLGRGALADPALAPAVARELGIGKDVPGAVADWPTRLAKLAALALNTPKPERALYRLKQWLGMAATFGRFMEFEKVKRAGSVDELIGLLRNVV